MELLVLIFRVSRGKNAEQKVKGEPHGVWGMEQGKGDPVAYNFPDIQFKMTTLRAKRNSPENHGW